MNRLSEEFYQLRSQIKATPAPKTLSLTQDEVREVLDLIGGKSSKSLDVDRTIASLRDWSRGDLSINEKD